MEIKFDKRNYRKHNDKNKNLINKSLMECGTGRSVVVDADGEIISGNGVYEQALKLNIPVKFVETDGSKLIVVKRKDLKYSDEKRKKLAVLDNSTSDTSEFDKDLLKEDFAQEELSDLGIVEIVNAEEVEKKDKEIKDGLIECPRCGYISSEEEFLVNKGE